MNMMVSWYLVLFRMYTQYMLTIETWYTKSRKIKLLQKYFVLYIIFILYCSYCMCTHLHTCLFEVRYVQCNKDSLFDLISIQLLTNVWWRKTSINWEYSKWDPCEYIDLWRFSWSFFKRYKWIVRPLKKMVCLRNPHAMLW